eukprot:5331592-Lingulodinium_polyedra.AAC.1
MSPAERVHAPLELLIERLATEQKTALQDAAELRRFGIHLHDFDTKWDFGLWGDSFADRGDSWE